MSAPFPDPTVPPIDPNSPVYGPWDWRRLDPSNPNNWQGGPGPSDQIGHTIGGINAIGNAFSTGKWSPDIAISVVAIGILLLGAAALLFE